MSDICRTGSEPGAVCSRGGIGCPCEHNDPPPPPPRGIVKIVDRLNDGRRERNAVVLVDGEPVATLPLTSWGMEGSPSTLPRVTVTLLLGDVVLKGLGSR